MAEEERFELPKDATNALNYFQDSPATITAFLQKLKQVDFPSFYTELETATFYPLLVWAQFVIYVSDCYWHALCIHLIYFLQ